MAVKSCIEWLTMSCIIGNDVGTVVAAAAKLKTHFLQVIICRWDIAGIDTAFRQKKFYKVAGRKDIEKSLIVMVFLTNKVLSNFRQIN